MTPTLLLLVPPLAFLVWRPDWPGVAVLLGAMALVAWRDWAASASAITKLRAEMERVDKDLRSMQNLTSENLVKLALQVKAAEETLAGHTRAIQAGAAKQQRGIL